MFSFWNASSSLRRKAAASVTVCSVLAVSITSMTLPGPVFAQVTSSSCVATYLVKQGDDLFRIAQANGTTWPILQQLNGISNPNLLFVGQTLCLPNSMVIVPIVVPTAVGPDITVTPVAPAIGSLVLPPPGVFPSITFDRQFALPGDTITITGVNFPTNGIADVFIKPLNSPAAYMVAAQTTTSATGTVNFAFSIPTAINGQALVGYAFSVLVKERTTGYFGFSFFYNGPAH